MTAKGSWTPEEGGQVTTKLCINCDTLNDPDAVFCSKCGMSLMGAPTPEEARHLAKEMRRRRKQPLTASGIVYV
ncbi:MAG TPA: zinc ribbon domain-containing protein, partial [Chloroflexi bacterium]|nr:zinc ribbon domain-containing protein [Chloroflexota bacterium]